MTDKSNQAEEDNNCSKTLEENPKYVDIIWNRTQLTDSPSTHLISQLSLVKDDKKWEMHRVIGTLRFLAWSALTAANHVGQASCVGEQGQMLHSFVGGVNRNSQKWLSVSGLSRSSVVMWVLILWYRYIETHSSINWVLITYWLYVVKWSNVICYD